MDVPEAVVRRRFERSMTTSWSVIARKRIDGFCLTIPPRTRDHRL
jgi:hypothetical protein